MYRVAKGLNHKLFNSHRPLTLSLLLMANARVSAFSAGSPTTAPRKLVGTHNGSFHCDEALGCFMIRLTNNFAAAEIVRTRDPQVLETLDAVLDVGECMIRTGNATIITRKGSRRFLDTVSLRSLVVLHYGKEIIARELQLDEGHPDVQRLFLAIYKSFMEGIDAIDNGINQYDTDQPPRYLNNTHLSARVGRLNLDWIDPDQSSEKENEAFERAMALAGSEFLDWKLHLFELEEEMKIDPPIKYVLYQDDRGKQWRVQAVAISPDKFESRKPLPSQWRGLRDEELSNESGIPGCVFVHMSGFIGGNQSYEGVMAMARAALKL
ncbi:metal-dependent protein hydrolase [Actinidia rufa]|uniref:Metal-dependent protein hydrolase n=1 Tax=Actinidia rufa TaxID=165716 RepID=A0A7J0DX96_9ERIC|nr:metal-dependent protein hydrolase [Actinidia rufa]